MNDQSKTNPELLEEVSALKRRIRELEKSESVLKLAEEESRSLASVVRHSRELVNLATPDGMMVFLNNTGKKMLGISEEEIAQTNILQVIPEHLQEKVQSEVLPSIERDGYWEGDLQYLNVKTGGLTDVHAITFKIADTETDMMQFLANVSLDISERKRAEEAKRESEDNYRSIFENAVEGFFQSTPEGRFLTVNPAFVRIFGYSSSEELISTISDISRQYYVNHEDRLRYMEMIQQKGSVENFEFKARRKDGAVIWISNSTRAITDKEGKIIRYDGFVEDITHRKQAECENRVMEERLNRAEKMEALGQLAGGVAHDLNNVLGVLSGYSELLLLRIPEGSESRGYVEKILQSTQKGAAIIEDLLTLARRGVTASDVINLNGVVSDYFKTPVFEKMKDYHPHVTFRTECDRDLLNIKGSSVHLEKTLMNLVSNAAEAVSGRGEVTIRTENRYLDKPLGGYDEVKEGDYAVLTVSDTGMGIPAESREKIFEPFYTKKMMGRSGTGLGLAIVWGTVKDHNGYIDMQTEVGKGTTFTLYFPVIREEMIEQQKKVPKELYMGNGESVLVVDDIADQRDIAAGLLAELGYVVHTASSGEEAVEYLRRNEADILVLDMIMTPGIDGLETYQRILEINPKQKAIIVSGFSETERVRKAQERGAGAYVKKPYIMEKIGMAIRDELNR